MNRRAFLKFGSSALAGSFFVPLLQACSSNSSHPSPGLSPTDASGASSAFGPMANYLSDFATHTFSETATEHINQWLDTLSASERVVVEATNNRMAGFGFYFHDGYNVFRHSSGLYFYGIGNENGSDACAPFFYAGDECAVLERPAISGLTQASLNWNPPLGVSVGDGLMPWERYAENEHYGTPAGHHIYLSQPDTGKIKVVSVHSNGGTLLDETYAI